MICSFVYLLLECSITRSNCQVLREYVEKEKLYFFMTKDRVQSQEIKAEWMRGEWVRGSRWKYTEKYVSHPPQPHIRRGYW